MHVNLALLFFFLPFVWLPGQRYGKQIETLMNAMSCCVLYGMKVHSCVTVVMVYLTFLLGIVIFLLTATLSWLLSRVLVIRRHICGGLSTVLFLCNLHAVIWFMLTFFCCC